jgi:hypothetical protein
VWNAPYALAVGIALAFTTFQAGKFNDPNERMEMLLHQNESFGKRSRESRAFWVTDQASHLTPARVHGGIGP